MEKEVGIDGLAGIGSSLLRERVGRFGQPLVVLMERLLGLGGVER